MQTIEAGAEIRLTTGSTVKVTLVKDGVAYITRADGKFPRAVRLDWLTDKARGGQA